MGSEINLILNPGFESSFKRWEVSGSFAIVKSPRSGIYAARSGTGIGTITQKIIGNFVGKNLTLSFYGKISSMAVSSMVSIRFKTENGGWISENKIVINTLNYKLYSSTFNVPANTAFIEIYAVKDNGKSYLYLDDLSLVPINTAPILLNTQKVTTKEGESINFNLDLGIDSNNDPLTYIKVSDPSSGSLICEGGFSRICTYIPAPHFTGATTFTYKTNDGKLDSNIATVLITVSTAPNSQITSSENYRPLGVGGGGAMSGVSISPYTNLWFVGTDMGTLFKSTNQGESWNAINHQEAVFDSDLSRSVSLGFSSDGKTIFHASGGIYPKISDDSGDTFRPISMGLIKGEIIKYFYSDSSNPNIMYAGTTKGLLKTFNKGISWSRITTVNEEVIGTFIDHNENGKLYQATKNQILVSDDNGLTFNIFHTPSSGKIRLFSGGSDISGVTLSYSDNDGINACSWVQQYLNDWGEMAIDETFSNCGYIWISKNGDDFKKNGQIAGDHLKMSENDSTTIYSTGSKKWIRQYGTTIYVSHDKGQTWALKLNQINYDVVPYAPWPKEKLERSAVALDVGWWDSGYESFAINLRNSNIVAGSGYFFLHSSLNAGENWKAAFTEYADFGEPTSGKKWKTRGLEVISIYKMKFHPVNTDLMYGAAADIGGLVSEDHGVSFRIPSRQYNSFYDYAFDPTDDSIAYAASGSLHDFPNEWHANATTANGGVYKTTNRGRSWTRLTPVDVNYNRQFLSVGYDSINGTIYAGTQEVGIAVSKNNGESWTYMNQGLPPGNKIIPQIEVDPNNGNVYALLTGDAPIFSNQPYTGIYLLDIANGATTWKLLRGIVNYPAEADAGHKLWYYPTAFAIDFNNPSTIWMVDYENHGNWLMTGAWKTIDSGATWNRMKQITHATDIKINSKNNDEIHVAGYYDLTGTWGNGGMLHSKDGGATWSKNMAPPLQRNARSVTLDPTDSSKIFYSYFGGGILGGPNPAH